MPVSLYSVYWKGGKVMLLQLGSAREAIGLLTKNNDKLTAKPARMAAKALKGGQSEFGDFQSGERILNLFFDPVPEEGYVNVYGRDCHQDTRKHAVGRGLRKVFPKKTPTL